MPPRTRRASPASATRADRPLFPAAGRLDTNHIAVEIGRRLLARAGDAAVAVQVAAHVAARVAELEAILSGGDSEPAAMERTPYFCRDARTIPRPGSRTAAGRSPGSAALISRQFMDRSTARYTHMGGGGCELDR